MRVTAEDFRYITDFVRDCSAISLGPGKEYLVESRLMPVARAAGLHDLGSLVVELRRPSPDPAFQVKVIEAMTTNETSFFRDHHPFSVFELEVIPELIARNAANRRLRIWSAGCSTGQELYSLAMILDRNFPELAAWDVTLVGTDLSNEVLARARAGRYSPLEVSRGLPPALQVEYFEQDGASYVLKEDLRSRCRFEQLNLAESWPVEAFDVVLCRNVLIYFELAVRRAVLDRIRRALTPGGYLYLGTAETTVGLVDGFTAVHYGNVAVYRAEVITMGEAQ
jgi:chemotaxis protein methyltransferase CheR